MNDRPCKTIDDLRDGIQEMVALADLLDIPLVAAMLDSALYTLKPELDK